MVNGVKYFQGRTRNVHYQQSCKDFTRYQTLPQNYQLNSICTNCVQRWKHTHRQICPANGKKCNNCCFTGHFGMKYRKRRKSQAQTSKFPRTNINQIDPTAKKIDDEESVNYVTSYQQLYDQVYDTNNASDSNNYVAAISCDSVDYVEPHQSENQIWKSPANAMIGSGSVVSLIAKTLANTILRTTPSAKWITPKCKTKTRKHFRMNL